MNTKLAFPAIILAILITSMLSVKLEIQKVKGAETTYVYIREDGSISPSRANITSLDNVTYTFTGNNYAFIIIERGNIIVDGSGCTLEGTDWGKGISWLDISNITVKSLRIKEFDNGINVYNSSDNAFYGNEITNNNNFGFSITSSSNNTIYENNVTNNGGYSYTGYSSIYIAYSSNNTIFLNNITSNTHLDGIELWGSSNNTICKNNISGNYYGIRFFSSNDNRFYGNNITASNYEGISLSASSNNTFYDNLLSDNNYGLDVSGYELSHYLNDINTSNLVDEKPVHYLTNQRNKTIDHLTYQNIGYLALVNSTNINVENSDLRNNGQGLLLAYTNFSRIAESNLVNNYDGFVLFSSFNNTIQANNVVANNNDGIYLWGYSENNRISKNNVTSNHNVGIYLSDSSNNTVYGNTIANNDYGIELDGSNNSIYLNNFVNNTYQIESYDLVNLWDNGFEGNYWSDYTGIDSDNDWRGDDPHIIDGSNQDNHPLMGPISFFNAGTWNEVTYFVHASSNSTVTDFYFNQSEKMVTFNVTGSDGTVGFCRVAVPKELLYSFDILDWHVRVNGTSVLFGRQEIDNCTYSFFSYTQSTQNVEIIGIEVIPEFPSLIILTLFMLATLLAVIIYIKKSIGIRQRIAPY